MSNIYYGKMFSDQLPVARLGQSQLLLNLFCSNPNCQSRIKVTELALDLKCQEESPCQGVCPNPSGVPSPWRGCPGGISSQFATIGVGWPSTSVCSTTMFPWNTLCKGREFHGDFICSQVLSSQRGSKILLPLSLHSFSNKQQGVFS